MPEGMQWELLAQHWRCTPAEAREQDENDVMRARAYIGAQAEAQREQAYFG